MHSSYLSTGLTTTHLVLMKHWQNQNTPMITDLVQMGGCQTFKAVIIDVISVHLLNNLAFFRMQIQSVIINGTISVQK